MPKVRDTATPRLDQATVERLARQTRRAAAARRTRHALATPVDSIKVDLEVWRTALKLAGGDVTRLIVESATSVLVLNRPKPGRRRA